MYIPASGEMRQRNVAMNSSEMHQLIGASDIWAYDGVAIVQGEGQGYRLAMFGTNKGDLNPTASQLYGHPVNGSVLIVDDCRALTVGDIAKLLPKN